MTLVFDDGLLLIGSENYSGNTNQISYSFERDELDVTAMGDVAHGVRLGLASFALGAQIFVDVTDNGNDETLFDALNLKTESAFTVANASVAGSVAHMGKVLEGEYIPAGEVGQMYEASLSFLAAENTPVARGKLLFNGNVTTTQTGSIFLLDPIAADEKLISNLHVTAVTGSGITLDETVEGGTDATFTIGAGYQALVTGIAGDIRCSYYSGGELLIGVSSIPGVWYSGVSAYNDAWTFYSSGITQGIYTIAYGAGLYVIAGSAGAIYTNTAITGTWALRTSGTAGLIQKVKIPSFAFSFLACGSSDAGTGYIATSNDGIAWTRRTAGLPPESFLSNASNGVLLVVVGTNRIIYTSADGITWAAAAGSWGGTETYNDIEYGNGVFVVVGENGLIKTSADGDTYTTRTSGTANHLTSVSYISASTWIAVGQNGAMVRSVDNGVTWASILDGTGNYSYSIVSGDAGQRAFIFGASGKAGVTVGAYQILSHTQVTTTKTSEQKLLAGQQPYSHYRAKSTVTGSPTYKVTHAVGRSKYFA